MIRVTILLFLPVSSALPTPTPAPDPKPPHIFQALNCMGHNGARVKTFYGTSPADCNHAEIFQTPVTKAAQIITVPPLHPLEAIHCLVKVKIYTATCGNTDSTNGRNFYLYNKEVVNEIFSPTPEECFKSNKTNQLVWIIPPAGSYPGEQVTSPLVAGRAQGKFYPYGQRPGTYSCSGFTWLDDRGKAHINAALEVVYTIEVRPRWLTYNRLDGRLVVPQLVSFQMADANQFKREVPPAPKPAIRHKDIHHTDPERIRTLEIVTRIATPEQQKILFSDLPGNDRNIKAIANDPHKSALVETIMAPFYKNFTGGAQEYREREWAKRSIDLILTWFADVAYGLFVISSQTIPTTQCDSSRVITETHQGELFMSNNKKFNNVYRFQDTETKVGLAASLGQEVTLCGRKVNSLHRANVFILIVDTVKQFLKIPHAGDQFLDPEMQTQSKIISLAATSTLNFVGMHEAMDVRACELHRNTIKNSLSLITHDLQEMVDSEGTPLLTFTQGEVVYAVECLKEDVIVRSTEGICCNELPVLAKDKNTGAFSVEMFLAPFSRRLTPFCSPTPCITSYPSYHNVSSPTELAYYKVTNGIPSLTKSIPPPLNPTGINNSYLLPNQENGILNEEQQTDLARRVHTGQAREAVVSTASLGVVASFHSWLAPIIHPIKKQVPHDFMNAFETVFSDGPIPGLLGKLPYYIQIGLGIITLALALWAGSHATFLIVSFIKTATVSLRDAFHTTLAPTFGMKRAIQFTNKQEVINMANMESLQSVTNTTKQIEVQNKYFQECIKEQVTNLQTDVQYLKDNCTCKIRSGQCQ